MPVNGRRGRPQGKCHRKQTATIRLAGFGVRVKGWGKSPPRDWQQERHGKPHREQDRIGTVRGETLEGCFRLTVRVGCVRHMATCAQDEWPPRSRLARGEGHTEPGLQASWQFLSPDVKRSLLNSQVAPSGAPVDSRLFSDPSAIATSRPMTWPASRFVSRRSCPATSRLPSRALPPARSRPRGERSRRQRHRLASSAARRRCGRRRRMSRPASRRNC